MNQARFQEGKPIVRTLGRWLCAAAVCTAALGSEQARADEATPLPDPVPIIGGGPVDTCDWPSTVFLENCTGTLIHPEIVVYAAHCGADRERVWFGEDISTGEVAPGQGFSVDTEYCVTNPKFDDPLLDIGEYRANDYAFCKLAEPVLDVPIVPPLMGCETTLLLSGTPVTLVGYGGTDQDTFAVKFEVETVLHYIDDWGAAVIGGNGQSPCAGDSGGPAFMQMPDGTWRAFGIVSGPNVGNCSDAMWFATIYNAIPFIEKESGIDVSVCHHGTGQWNPSPSCGEFPLEPWNGEGKSWDSGCGGGPISEQNATCGPAFDPSEDLVGPVASITAPEDRQRFDTAAGEDTIEVVTTAEVSDAPSGVSTVALSVDGTIIDNSLLLSPPWQWELQMPAGVWDLQVVATDWAGNETISEAIVIGIDQDPPPAPEPSTSTGMGTGDASSTGDEPGDASTGGAASGSSTGSDDDGGSTSGAMPEQTDADDGCSCSTSPTSGRGLWLLVFAALFGVRRRRRAAAALSVMLSAGCSDSSSPGEQAETTGATETTDPSTTATATATMPTTAATGEDSTSTGQDPSSSTGPGTTTTEGSSTTQSCAPGTLDCVCTETFECDEGLSCQLDTCVACEAGTLNCPCSYPGGGRQGECEPLLQCFGGLCVNPQPCPFLMDGHCDEPQGSGVCLEGTDSFDCCPTQEGVCEEESMGGRCPDGSDPADCGGDTDTDGGTGTGTGSTGGTGGN